MPYFIVLLLLVVATACRPQEDAARGDVKVVGSWSVVGIYSHGNDIDLSCKLNPSCEPPDHGWVELTQDGQYMHHYDDPSRRETGRWMYREEKKYNALHLDRDERDDLDWLVTLEGDMMTWDGVEQKRFWERSRDDGWPPETNGFKMVFERR